MGGGDFNGDSRWKWQRWLGEVLTTTFFIKGKARKRSKGVSIAVDKVGHVGGLQSANEISIPIILTSSFKKMSFKFLVSVCKDDVVDECVYKNYSYTLWITNKIIILEKNNKNAFNDKKQCLGVRKPYNFKTCTHINHWPKFIIVKMNAIYNFKKLKTNKF